MRASGLLRSVVDAWQAESKEEGGGGGAAAEQDNGSPRVFCLQKLVEVADYNIKCRSRIQWSNMWKIMSQQFTVAGIHSDPGVAQCVLLTPRGLNDE